MAKLGSGSVVTVLTAGALAVVAVLAVQAKSSASTTAASGTAGKAPSVAASSTPGSKATPDKPAAVPKDSGTGKRVVYSVSQKRVWLFDPNQPDRTRTFTVQPGTLDPTPGSYAVMSTTAGPITGSDGKQVKNIVRFTTREGLFIGFSSAVDGSTPTPDQGKKTGGIRETVADGQALFDFAPYNTKVVVVA